jgi:predicted DNA-binding transcriptional regulator AlpA
LAEYATIPVPSLNGVTKMPVKAAALSSSTGGATATPRFRSVPDTAEILGMSEVTLYRAIREGQFPAIKVRGRYVVPSRVLDDMESAAIASGSVVDAADYTPPGPSRVA